MPRRCRDLNDIPIWSPLPFSQTIIKTILLFKKRIIHKLIFLLTITFKNSVLSIFIRFESYKIEQMKNINSFNLHLGEVLFRMEKLKLIT